ncbi:hypothetical protein YC2023_021269 [Brassica napus]
MNNFQNLEIKIAQTEIKGYSPVRLVAAGFGVSGGGSVNEDNCYANAAAYYIATAGFIGVSCRMRRSNAASDATSCVNETNKS